LHTVAGEPRPDPRLDDGIAPSAAVTGRASPVGS
jgi:hypothetical protein